MEISAERLKRDGVSFSFSVSVRFSRYRIRVRVRVREKLAYHHHSTALGTDRRLATRPHVLLDRAHACALRTRLEARIGM